MKNKKFFTNLLAIALVVALTLAIIPTKAFAAEGELFTSLNKNNMVLNSGDTLQLKVLGLADGAKVTWSTDAKKVATVSKKGKVTAKNEGYVQIKATITKGNQVEESLCNISVYNDKTAQKVAIKDTRVAKTLKLDGKNAMVVNWLLPNVTVKDNTTATKRINNFFKNIRKELNLQAEDYLPSFADFGGDEPYASEFDYTTVDHSGRILSLDCDQYAYFGGPHPSTICYGYNFDLNTGKEITLKKLFKNQDKANEIIWNGLINWFKSDPDVDHSYEIEYCEQNKEFAPSLEGKFTIKDKELYFTLSAGDYLPYAVGVESWSVMVDELKGCLSSYGKKLFK